MSHNVMLTAEYLNLDALRLAVLSLSMNFEERSTFRAYSNYRGEFGPCQYVLSCSNNPRAYEIGVARQPNGTYKLITDFYNGGYGLQNVVGDNAQNILSAYETEVTRQQLLNQGYDVSVEFDAATGGRIIYARN